jgi:hypothetical protein
VAPPVRGSSQAPIVAASLPISGTARWLAAPRTRERPGIQVAHYARMLKLVGSYAIAKLLGFGVVGAIVIYVILSMLS